MIIITGAAGFIGSNIIASLNEKNYKDLVLVDDFNDDKKLANYNNKIYSEQIHRNDFLSWLEDHHSYVQIVIHMGARTDTTESDWKTFLDLNLDYSKKLWLACVKYGLPLIYASSAATYGEGKLGYDDNHTIVSDLQPLNAYGRSKNDFDKWVLQQEQKPFFWSGLKFFNVYGPNEYHKGRMASVVFHAYNQIIETGKMKLFRSHISEVGDGEQARDFIFVKDVVDAIIFLMEERPQSAIFNLGTGTARSFNDLVEATFTALQQEVNIEFIDTPADIRDKYQYFTEAKVGKLRSIGFIQPFTTLEAGVHDYVVNYLQKDTIR